MSLLKDHDKAVLRTKFNSELKGEVRLIFFTQDLECLYCRETRQILNEVVDLSAKITYQEYNFVIDPDKVAEFDIPMIPATVVMGQKDYGIRLFGIPSGYEFTSLIEAVLLVSTGESGLSATNRAMLADVEDSLKISVFVTPTCPYCPGAVQMGFRMAIESDWITAAMIEATEFPHLAQRFNVSGVPKTVINDGAVDFVGALPEHMFIPQALHALNRTSS